MVETMLWNKIAKVCKEADVPLDESAPDYVVAPTAAPPMSVFQLASEPPEEEEEVEEAMSAGFIRDDEEE